MSAAIADMLRERILSGAAAPDLPLRQDAIAAELGVSKIPLREAMARLEREGLVRAEPMRTWLSQRQDFPLIGGLFDEPWMPYLMSWGGCILDLAVVPLLLRRRTRPFAAAAAVLFHLTNARLSPREALPGALLGTTLLLVTFQFLPLFTRLAGDVVSLKVLGTGALLIVWLYVLANVIVFGAELNWQLAYGRHGISAVPKR